MGQERTRSRWIGEHSSPTADSTPARGGTTTAAIPRASASAQAWSGPAPPKATRARPRGSTPRSTVTVRTARSMAASTTATTPPALDARPLQRGLGRRPVQPPEPGEGGVGRDAPEDQVGVRDRGLGPAPAVAGGPRVGPGRRRPHHQRAAGVHPGDGATAGADGVHVERRQPHRVPRRRPPGGGLGHPAEDEAHVRARAPHVEGHGVGEAAGGGHRGAGPHPAGRPGQQQGGGQVGRRRRPAASPPAEVITSTSSADAREAPQVGPAAGTQVGVQDRGHRALVLPELRRHLARARHVEAPGLEHVGHGPLVGRVEVAVQEADGHRLDVGVELGDRRHVDRLQLRPVGRQPPARPRSATPGARAGAGGRPTRRRGRAGPGGRSR